MDGIFSGHLPPAKSVKEVADAFSRRGKIRHRTVYDAEAKAIPYVAASGMMPPQRHEILA